MTSKNVSDRISISLSKFNLSFAAPSFLSCLNKSEQCSRRSITRINLNRFEQCTFTGIITTHEKIDASQALQPQALEQPEILDEEGINHLGTCLWNPIVGRGYRAQHFLSAYIPARIAPFTASRVAATLLG